MTKKNTVTTADGSQIFYETTGTGTPLFLLHGNGGSSDYFSYQVPVLSRYFKVYTIDLRGHGRSTNTQDKLSFDLLSDDLYLITAQENIHSLNILGFSDGANLAIYFAASHPAMVKHLILNAGNTEFQGLTPFSQISVYLEYFWFRLLGIYSSKWRKRAVITHLMLRDIGITERDLERISAKTLVIVGKKDVIKLTHSMYLAEKIPKASFVLIPGQGHLFARKDPNLFNKNVLSFLLEKQVNL
ncbi:alpha/beta fold hydrolase [Enterococcus sp. LJL51]|uniref:alpha/beta fold hydrolase n=1 Tax=Enterococcus sp. LJL51 TaxID=3416656 RepID=UPI003CF207C3